METNKLDCFIYPTMSFIPPTIAEVSNDKEEISLNGKMGSYFALSIANTDLIAIIDFPSISLPILTLEGKPTLVSLEICVPNKED